MKTVLRLCFALVLQISWLQISAKGASSNVSATIDFNDTIAFDIENAGYMNGKMLIPIIIYSDDTIFSLDFSLQYNHLQLAFDTVYDPAGAIQPFVYYNPVDSTLRLTSSSFTPYPKNTTIFILQFSVLGLPVLPGDIFQVLGYLNGDQCSVFQPAVIFTSVETNEQASVTVYPNPASDLLAIESSKQCSVTMYSITGVKYFSLDSFSGLRVIDLSIYPDGIYLLKINIDGFITIKKVLVRHL